MYLVFVKSLPVVLFALHERPKSCFLRVFLSLSESPGMYGADMYRFILVDDMIEIYAAGIEVNNQVFHIAIKNAIFDSPARSSALFTKGHTGFSSCSQCTIVGETYKNRRIFVNISASLRTDASFQNRTRPSYHRGTSVLERVIFKMVSQVPLDYLHVVLLGVQKRFVFIWTESSEKLEDIFITKISQRLETLKEFLPREFAKKPRSLEVYRRWKGKEFRGFLLYYSMLVLHGVLDESKYNHFMCLVVAIRILVSKYSSVKLIDYADKLLRYFVSNL